ncbi:MAG: serine hydrolase [Bacteroidales bacterium]|nr:serine hydrolase [Bacteroidales bacterium]
MARLAILILIIFLAGCKKTTDDPTGKRLYFPPVEGSEWKATSPESLDWNLSGLETLNDVLEGNGTRAFIILKDGKIVVEQYWGNNILNTAPFDESSVWYWASAGKTITAFLTGIAQQEGLLNINDRTTDYLGMGWTSAPLLKENIITIRHQLTMTTGLDYNVADLDCTNPSCLLYKADAGTQWYYHNAPYTLLEDVISEAAATDYNSFTDSRLEAKTGMSGTWLLSGDYNNVYYSTARDAARFGLLILNKGRWDKEDVLADTSYYRAMVNTSQDINLSYGYLWWLNGKSSVIYPGLTVPVGISVAPAAPADMFAAMGKNGQFINVIPSLNMVVVRMGEAPGTSLVPVTFHNEMWQKIMAVIQQP